LNASPPIARASLICGTAAAVVGTGVGIGVGAGDAVGDAVGLAVGVGVVEGEAAATCDGAVVGEGEGVGAVAGAEQTQAKPRNAASASRRAPMTVTASTDRHPRRYGARGAATG